MSLQRTGDFVSVKTRSLQWENADGSIPAIGAVMTTNALGAATWTTDPVVDSVTARDQIVLMDGEAASGVLTYRAGVGLRVNGAAVGGGGGVGATGPQGPTGPVGSAGGKGDQGDTGPRGATGPAGGKGDQGDTGPQGPAGSAGSAGAKGDQGDTGPQGPTGPSGSLPIVGGGGVYNNPTSITVNQYGQVTNVIAPPIIGGLVGDSTYTNPVSITTQDGKVTNITTADNLVQDVTGTIGQIAVGGTGQKPTLSLENSGVVAGYYTNANVTVDAKGRITDVSSAQYSIKELSTSGTSLEFVSSFSNTTTLKITFPNESGNYLVCGHLVILSNNSELISINLNNIYTDSYPANSLQKYNIIANQIRTCPFTFIVQNSNIATVSVSAGSSNENIVVGSGYQYIRL